MTKVTFFSTSMPLDDPDADADLEMISDSIEKEMHNLDTHAEINCATHVENGVAMIACEVEADASIDASEVVRNTIQRFFGNDAPRHPERAAG